MNYKYSIAFASLFTLIACSKKITSPAATPVNQAETKTETPVAIVTQPVSTAKPPAMPGTDDMAQSLYANKCTRCHGLKDPGNFTASRWDGILNVMVPRANLTSDEKSTIVNYIKAHAKP